MSKLTQSLDLRQSQTLVMTPQLQQAIKLLQLNNVELSEFLEQEMEQNPLLEKGEKADEYSASAGDDQDNGSADAEAGPDRQESEDSREESFAAEWQESQAESEGNDFDPGHYMADVGSGGDRNFENPDFSYENTISADKTLRDHLLEQLHMDVDDDRDCMIGTLLIDQLDESGYLREDPEKIAQRLNCSVERISALLKTMKNYDPTGVFAADLPECLALQLEEKGQLDDPMRVLLDNLDLVANHDFSRLADHCGVNETYLHDMIAEIRALNPRPSSHFEHFVAQTVIPDVLMKKLPKEVGGGWRVELNSDTLPKVLVNQEYYTQVANHAKSKDDKTYISQKLTAANWLVRALDQRAQTIVKVAGEIVEEQNAFFLFGIEYLRPMTLKDIAEKVEMHESTISRVTTNKYIGTPRGIFELKYFFSTALSGAGGSSHSAESVRARIKALIDAEKSDAVLSDDAIVETLKSEGVDIARRTVAKYREAMHIPSSVQRRKIKKNQAGSA